MQLSKVALYSGLCLLASLNSASAETFLGELDVLLSTHPRLQASGAAVRSSQAGEGIARGDFLPTLTLTGDAGFEETDSPATRAAGRTPEVAGNPNSNLETSRYSSSVFLTLNLFDGFRVD